MLGYSIRKVNVKFSGHNLYLSQSCLKFFTAPNFLFCYLLKFSKKFYPFGMDFDQLVFILPSNDQFWGRKY